MKERTNDGNDGNDRNDRNEQGSALGMAWHGTWRKMALPGTSGSCRKRGIANP